MIVQLTKTSPTLAVAVYSWPVVRVGALQDKDSGTIYRLRRIASRPAIHALDRIRRPLRGQSGYSQTVRSCRCPGGDLYSVAPKGSLRGGEHQERRGRRHFTGAARLMLSYIVIW